MDISGKVAAITGGASGLGEATVRHFLQSGARVVILDLNDENAKKLIDELGDENLKYINTNIMEEEPVKKAMDFIQNEFGALHIAVNCAGTGYGNKADGAQYNFCDWPACSGYAFSEFCACLE